MAAVALGGCSTTLAQFEPAREVVCFETAKVSLTEAVAAAERQGGRVIDAHYHQPDELGCLTDKPGDYAVTMLEQGRFINASVDARSGAVAVSGQRTASNYVQRIFAGDPEAGARASLQIPLRMRDAIALAERKGGRAMKAYVETRDGKPGYLVKLVESGGKVRATWIDGGALALSEDE